MVRLVKTLQKSTPRMPNRDGSTTVFVVLVLAVIAIIAVAVLGYYIAQNVSSNSEKHLTAEVTQTDFVNDIVESGEVESSENVEVRCEVKSRNGAGTTILDVIPEGTLVRGPHLDENGEMVPGTLLVTLDASGLELEKQQEGIILNNKTASRDQAKNLLIAAISALKEYTGRQDFEARFLDDLIERLGDEAEEVMAAVQSSEEGDTEKGTFHVEEQGIQAELFQAEETLRTSEQYFRYNESLAAQGYVTELQLKSVEFAVEKARKDRDAAQTKLDVLRIHTRKKTEKTLSGDIYNALAVFRAEKNSVQLQLERMAEIEEQIKKCVIYAPQDGQVVYANERDHRGNADFLVEPGATLRERQVIIRLPDANKMQIEAKISESKIALVRKGMKATVEIDAFDGMALEGVVTRVNQYAAPSHWSSPNVKQYETEVQILDPPAELKSGLTAKVRIHAQYIPNAVQIPIQSAYRHNNKYYCFVKEGKGWRAQEVELGASNEKFVVVTDGIDPQARVSMTPASLLDEVDLPEIILDGEQMVADSGDISGRYVSTNAATTTEAESDDDSTSEERQGSLGGGMNAATIVAAMFSSSDANKDGKLTEDEMPDRFRDSFSETDANSDGGIDRAELTTAIQKRMQNRGGGGGPGRGPSGAEE